MGKKEKLQAPAGQVASKQAVHSTVTTDQERAKHAQAAADLLDLIARLIADAIYREQQPQASDATERS